MQRADSIALPSLLPHPWQHGWQHHEVGTVTVHRGAAAVAGVVVHHGELPDTATGGQTEGASVRVHVGSAPVLEATPITAG
ncbi:hypothetical protein [Sphingomonas sp.]|uniref:hypothetical protein n=1 Tax=Sphingomonas sp. TaxID=28214 RepID=UPI003AFFD2F2